MRALLVVICFVCLAFKLDNAITNHTWQLVKISDFNQQRFLQTQAQKVLCSLFGDHLQIISCDTITSTCNFVSPAILQTKLTVNDNKSCGLPYRQINWYLRYRFSSLVYVQSGDTLDLRDKSGVNYTLVKVN